MNTQTDTQATAGRRQSSYSSHKTIPGIIAIAAVASLGTWYVDTRRTAMQEPVYHASTKDAAIEAKSFVSQKLQYPKTVQFLPAREMKVVTLPPKKVADKVFDAFQVTSYVETKDSSGATMRRDFVVTLHYLAGKGRWYLDDINIEQKK